MLDDLQRLFRRSLDAFRAELGRREPEDEVAELLGAMRREMVAARAALPLLAEEVTRARAELSRERELLAQCERRSELAQRIGDAETVRVADEFAARHRERVGVLQKKVEAAEAERALRSREAEEMERRYREADANRFALVAQLRRQATSDRMRGRLDEESGPFADFARMEEAAADAERYVSALEEMQEGGGATSPPPRPPDVEERLAELKRRMGKG